MKKLIWLVLPLLFLGCTAEQKNAWNRSMGQVLKAASEAQRGVEADRKAFNQRQHELNLARQGNRRPYRPPQSYTIRKRWTGDNRDVWDVTPY